MKKSRFIDGRIVAVLKQGGWHAHRRCAGARHQFGDVAADRAASHLVKLEGSSMYAAAIACVIFRASLADYPIGQSNLGKMLGATPGIAKRQLLVFLNDLCGRMVFERREVEAAGAKPVFRNGCPNRYAPDRLALPLQGE